MRYLLDTGILLRLVNRQADGHDAIRAAVRALKNLGHSTLSSFQNRSEFWNVCTRPQTARGGLGLTADETRRRLAAIERIAPILPDVPEVYEKWRELVTTLGVAGVQVHDAKLVALMITHGVSHILTLNARDFSRYLGIDAVAPGDVASMQSGGG
jgi:predicted nucleic acid-binding protein